MRSDRKKLVQAMVTSVVQLLDNENNVTISADCVTREWKSNSPVAVVVGLLVHIFQFHCTDDTESRDKRALGPGNALSAYVKWNR